MLVKTKTEEKLTKIALGGKYRFVSLLQKMFLLPKEYFRVESEPCFSGIDYKTET